MSIRAKNITRQPSIRNEVWNKTNGICWYCGIKMSKFDGTFTVDHFISKADGGEDKIENLVPCCKSCNSSKRNKTLEQFRSFRSRPNGIYFTDAQIRYLESIGVTLPKKEIRFYYEITEKELYDENPSI